jgi:L-serine/L-threonine ammonia-lyase
MPLHVVTPLVDSAPLGRACSARVSLKLESLQPTGSFKIRGIGRACEEAAQAGTRRFVTSSGGNAGLAVAYAGRLLGVPVSVFVPRTTSARMIDKMRDEGASVEVHGEAWDDAHAAALRACEARARACARQGDDGDRAGDAFYVHPFDMPAVWHGNATLVEEVVTQGLASPEAVVVAVGGGGLLCGVLEGMHAVGWADVPVVAVETEGAASFHAAIRAGQTVDIGALTSIATTLGARRVCERALAWTREHRVTSWVVSDRAAVDACMRFADDHRIVVEPACGAALAAVYDWAAPLGGMRSVLVVVCGGAGATPADLVRWNATIPR